MRRPFGKLIRALLIGVVMVTGLLLTWGVLAWRRADTPEPGTVVRTLQVDGRERTYTLHVPANTPPPPGPGADSPARVPHGKPLPLVLVFHGGGGSAAQVERMTRFSELADCEGFLVAYPQGFGRSWNDGRGLHASPAQRANVDDVAFVTAMIEDIARTHPVDPARVYATGVSNGGFFCHYLAAYAPERIAAIAPVIGGISESLARAFAAGASEPSAQLPVQRDARPMDVLIIQGTADPLVPYEGGDVTLPWGPPRGRVIPTEEAVRLWVEHNGCASEPIREELPDADSGDGCRVVRLTYAADAAGATDAANAKGAKRARGADVVLYRMEGGGHAWPGPEPVLRKRLVGGVCQDVNGTEVIWQFFKARTKP